MWDLIVSVPDHCLSFYLGMLVILSLGVFIKMRDDFLNTPEGFRVQVMHCVCCHTQLVLKQTFQL